MNYNGLSSKGTSQVDTPHLGGMSSDVRNSREQVKFSKSMNSNTNK
jgi:hypothetical protein